MKRKNKTQEKTFHLTWKKLWEKRVSPILARSVGRNLLFAFLLAYGSITGLETISWLLQRDQFIYEVGDIAQQDILLEKELVFLDEEATQRKRALRVSTVNPQFVMQENTTLQVLNRYDNFRDPLLVYLEDKEAQSFPQELLDILPVDLLRSISALDDSQRALDMTREIIVTIMYRGYIRLLPREEGEWQPDELIDIVASGGTQSIRTTTSIGEVLTRDNLEAYIDGILQGQYSSIEQEQIKALVLYFIEENCYYNQFETENQRNRVSQMVDPVYIKYGPGDILIYQGVELTERDMDKLKALRNQLGSLSLSSFIYPLVYLLLILFISFSFLIFVDRKVFKPQNMILSFYLLVVYIFILKLLIQFSQFSRESLYLVILPVGMITLLLSQILSYKEDLLMFSLSLALSSFFISGGSEVFLIFTLVSAMAGLLVLPRGEKRIDLLKAGVRLGLIHFLLIASLLMYRRDLSGAGLIDLLLALFSGPAAALLVMFLLPLFEQFMNSCTSFRLSELSNLNDPIMKRMFIRAPGTYVHSINVAYMAEPACESIGANSMLARVGGYYHDIGKIDQAEYYIENQKDGNKHDELKASLSAAIIKSHVKAGIEKARELRLPGEIIDIIAQHHGTSLIRYFYDRALKDEKSKSSIKKEDFCHPGPRPQTKEGAVVMLADTVEAATRTLRKPTRAKLEKFIWELIIDKFQNGELNDSGLTLKELEIIKENFVHVLTGHFHSRVEYPQQNGDAHE